MILVDGGGALGDGGGRGRRQVLRKEALNVVEGIADDEMEGSERRERRGGGCHGRRVTTGRGEGE